MEHHARILHTASLTPDVKSVIIEKPQHYAFTSGQAISVKMFNHELRDKSRIYSLASTPQDDFLEFMVKNYLTSDALSRALHEAKPDTKLVISEPFGSLRYQGEGLFIAAGTGIAPFLSIFRALEKENNLKGNSLIFSVKNQADIIAEQELRKMFQSNAFFFLTQEANSSHNSGRITQSFLAQHAKPDKFFYISGPMQFVADIKKMLLELGIKSEKIVG